MHNLFPEIEKGVCVCGCGGKITGKRRKWASDECTDYGWFVYCILTGRHDQIYKAIWTYYGSEIGIPCLGCGELNTGIEIDHTHPVHKGGGCCWLSNLKPLCIPCHKEKTKIDLKPEPKKGELSLF